MELKIRVGVLMCGDKWHSFYEAPGLERQLSRAFDTIEEAVACTERLVEAAKDTVERLGGAQTQVRYEPRECDA